MSLLATRYRTPFPYPPMPAYRYPQIWVRPLQNQAIANSALQINAGALAYSQLPGVGNFQCVRQCQAGCTCPRCLAWCVANCRSVGWW